MQTGVAVPTETAPIEEESEPDATQDNQERLDALKLHDESASTKTTSVSDFHVSSR